MHIYKLSEWESANGMWNCGDVEDLANGSNKSWHPCRLLGVTAEEYVQMLADQFAVDYMKYDLAADVLFFSWKSQAAMRKYKNYINKLAREKNFKV